MGNEQSIFLLPPATSERHESASSETTVPISNITFASTSSARNDSFLPFPPIPKQQQTSSRQDFVKKIRHKKMIKSWPFLQKTSRLPTSSSSSWETVEDENMLVASRFTDDTINKDEQEATDEDASIEFTMGSQSEGEAEEGSISSLHSADIPEQGAFHNRKRSSTCPNVKSSFDFSKEHVDGSIADTQDVVSLEEDFLQDMSPSLATITPIARNHATDCSNSNAELRLSTNSFPRTGSDSALSTKPFKTRMTSTSTPCMNHPDTNSSSPTAARTSSAAHTKRNASNNKSGNIKPNRRLTPPTRTFTKSRKVKPFSSYPNIQMTQDELYQEMKKPSSHYQHLDNNIASPSIGTLEVEVLSCLGLPKSSSTSTFNVSSKTDTMVYLLSGSDSFITDVIPSCLSPLWPCKSKRACLFDIHHAYARLYVGVFDKASYSRSIKKPVKKKEKKNDGFIGRVVIDLSVLRPNTEYDVTLPLRISSHAYDRRPRGAVRLRFCLTYESERMAITSYFKTSVAKKKPNEQDDHEQEKHTQTTIKCSDPNTFRNVALTLYGIDLPGKFSGKAFLATRREYKLYSVHIKALLKKMMKDILAWKQPLLSSYLFWGWMHCVYINSMRMVPPYVCGFLVLLMSKNYYRMKKRDENSLFTPLTPVDLFLALLFGGSNSNRVFMQPISVESRRSQDVYADSSTVISPPSESTAVAPEDSHHFNGSRINVANHEEFPFSDQCKLSVEEALVPREKRSTAVENKTDRKLRLFRSLSSLNIASSNRQLNSSQITDEHSTVDTLSQNTDDHDTIYSNSESETDLFGGGSGSDFSDDDDEDDDNLSTNTVEENDDTQVIAAAVTTIKIAEDGACDFTTSIKYDPSIRRNSSIRPTAPPQNVDKTYAPKKKKIKNHLKSFEDLMHEATFHIGDEQVAIPATRRACQEDSVALTNSVQNTSATAIAAAASNNNSNNTIMKRGVHKRVLQTRECFRPILHVLFKYWQEYTINIIPPPAKIKRLVLNSVVMMDFMNRTSNNPKLGSCEDQKHESYLKDNRDAELSTTIKQVHVQDSKTATSCLSQPQPQAPPIPSLKNTKTPKKKAITTTITTQDEFDKRLGLKPNRSNPVATLQAEYLGPIMRIMQIWNLTIRSAFHVWAWKDPFLSFLFLLFLIGLTLLLIIFPWREFLFLVGLFVLGPQNFIFNEARRKEKSSSPIYSNKTASISTLDVAKEATNQPPKDTNNKNCNTSNQINKEGNPEAANKKSKRQFSFLKKRLRKSGSSSTDTLVQPTLENSTVDVVSESKDEFGQQVSKNKVIVREVIVPYTPLRKQRFYDWPPDPTVSRATAKERQFMHAFE